MTSYSETVCKAFDQWDERELRQSLENLLGELHARRINTVEYRPRQDITPERQTKANCALLQQALLHRAERLLVSSGTMLVENNVYGLALMVRGHYEATAMLGYFCDRLDALAFKNISPEEFGNNVATAILSARHSQFSRAPDPLNILSCIDKTDRYLDKNFFKSRNKMLRDCYDWLSEFSHPNFLSNSSAFTLDKENNQMVLRHEGGLQKRDFQLMGYLETSATVFVYLFDEFDGKIDTAFSQ